MKARTAIASITFAAAAAFSVSPLLGVEPAPNEAKTSPAAAAPNDSEMMELTKLNENHKLLAELAGNWSYTVKMWMAPGAPPIESKGRAERKAIMGGRYFVVDAQSEMEMPGPDGKMQSMSFIGHSWEGYDNAKKKFVSSWIDNMGTGILMSEGTYDPASKTFTYNAEMEMAPGVKTKVREVVKVVDKDHHLFEWYENRGGQETKTMEIAYTRAR